MDWGRDLSANIVKGDNVYPVRLNVIPPKAGFAAWTTEGEDPTHEELVEHLWLRWWPWRKVPTA